MRRCYRSCVCLLAAKSDSKTLPLSTGSPLTSSNNKKSPSSSSIPKGLYQLHIYARQHVMLSASLLRQRRPSVRPSVCPSVCLSHCCIMSKRRNLGSWNLHCGLPQGLLVFFVTNFRAAGWGDSPWTRASNKGTPARKKSSFYRYWLV